MNKKMFSLIGTGLTFFSLILWFLVPAMKYNGIIKFEFSFLDLTFGKSMSVLGESVKVWNFSVFNLITLVLILITLALLIISVLEIPNEKRTVSIGLSLCDYNCCEKIEVFIDKADKALYKAKKAGRNRVEFLD